MKTLGEDDIILIQALDNAAYYSQTEDSGDVPVQRCSDNKFHVVIKFYGWIQKDQ